MADGPLTTRDRLLEAAQTLFVMKGFALTTVDEICARAGATKGAFFHHFENKDDIALKALERFAYGRLALMQAGSDEWPEEPIERLFAYVRHVSAASLDANHPRGCLIAILAMELGATSETFRRNCDLYFGIWADYVRGLVADAVAAHPKKLEINPADLADHFVTIFEGSVVLARSSGDMRIFERNLSLFEQYLRFLFAGTAQKRARAVG